MSSGVSRVRSGSVWGTGATIDVRTVGFRPQRVEYMNWTDKCHGVWHKDMADASVMKVVTAGTITAETTLGITPLSDGFQIGADTDLNVADQLIHWTAYE